MLLMILLLGKNLIADFRDSHPIQSFFGTYGTATRFLSFTCSFYPGVALRLLVVAWEGRKHQNVFFGSYTAVHFFK